MILRARELATVLLLSATSLAVAGIVWKKRWSRLTSKGYLLPPGPPTRSFWDNIVPTVNTSSTFNGWGNEYGPVFTLRQGGEIAIVIARVNAATEIMEKEGNALADRPRQIAANELLSGGKRVTLINNGEQFRRLRKVIHSHLQPKAVEKYKDLQFEQARTLVLDLLDDPDKLQKRMHRFSTSIILRIAYGKSAPTSIDDPDFAGVKETVAHFVEGMRAGGYLVDRFPWLKYVPGYGRRLRSFYKSDLKFYRSQLDRVKREMSSDDASPSFSRMLLETAQENQLSYDEMAFLAGTLFEAGSDTSSHALSVMTMASACFPDAQLRVQEELDKVVGADKLPDWTDWNTLPQLHAFIAEAHRWRPVTPLGFAHRSTRDISWRSYLIPAGTAVHANLWAISRDPEAFPDPEKFDPQRWLHENGQLRSDLQFYPFGFGRRVCPGLHLANRSIFIGLALLLWSFRVVERPGSPIDTTPDKDNAVARQIPFVVDFVPRIKEAHLREMMTMTL